MKTSQSALHALAFDPLLARLFANTKWHEVSALADWIASADPYREAAHVRRALNLISAGTGGRAFFEHQLWCAWRQAAWTSGLAAPLPMRIEGETWLRETEGFPTLLVTPMTLATDDAMNAIARLNTTGRGCIVFGEDIDVSDALTRERIEIVGGASVTGLSREMVRRILQVLDDGGVLCTYADFVYEGRTADAIPLFGIERPVSAGFLSLAARNGTMLLPLICLREGDAIVVQLDEPVRIQDDRSAGTPNPVAARALVANAVGNLLESLIRRAPEQWLLLPTLTFESPEMARAAPLQDASPNG
jgi:hypothetical protein